MYNLEIILRKYVRSLITRRYGLNHIIQYSRDDRQTPWHIYSFSRRCIDTTSSFKDASALLFKYRHSSVDIDTEKEIIVWMRLQPIVDKEELTYYVSSKFHLTKAEADRLFYRAFPDYLSDAELTRVHELEQTLPNNLSQLSVILDYLSGVGSLQDCDIDSYTVALLSNNIDDILKERFLLV